MILASAAKAISLANQTKDLDVIDVLVNEAALRGEYDIKYPKQVNVLTRNALLTAGYQAINKFSNEGFWLISWV